MRAELQVQSWLGRSINACHYYGFLDTDNGPIEIERALTAKEARDLNKLEKQNGRILGINFSLTKWKTGDRCRQFNSFEALVKAIPDFIQENNLGITEVYYSNEDNVVWTLN